MIEDTITILPVEKNNENWFIIGEQDGKRTRLPLPKIKSLQNLKLLSKHVISVPAWWIQHYDLKFIDFADIFYIPQYIHCCDISENEVYYSVGSNGKGMTLNG